MEKTFGYIGVKHCQLTYKKETYLIKINYYENMIWYFIFLIYFVKVIISYKFSSKTAANSLSISFLKLKLFF